MAANLKNDLLNKLGTDRSFKELEFIRLANEPNMSYEIKIETMHVLAKEIGVIDLAVNVVNFYFKEPVAAAQQPAQAQNGQSHAE